MKPIHTAIFSCFFTAFASFGQLPNGSVAPDFELTDLNGNSHHLYQYLDEGKVVFVEFFACHCPSCWGYHNMQTLRNLYNAYGPEGTDQIRVLMIDQDEYNGDAFYGQGGYTQGDWTANNPIPMIDAEGSDRTIFSAYNMTYYPLVYKICPDKTTEVMSTAASYMSLYQLADDCPGTLGVEDQLTTGRVYFDAQSSQLKVEAFAHAVDLQIFTLSGQEVSSHEAVENGSLDVSAYEAGVYLVRVRNEGQQSVLKILLP